MFLFMAFEPVLTHTDIVVEGSMEESVYLEMVRKQGGVCRKPAKT